jgi:hypothetical protein
VGHEPQGLLYESMDFGVGWARFEKEVYLGEDRRNDLDDDWR